MLVTGPLTEGALAEAVGALAGGAELNFYDAVAPIVTAESLDYEKVFAASRYGRGEADYLNCPFNKPEYEAFYAALASAERAPLHDFDRGAEAVADAAVPQSAQKDGGLTVYEGCMPIEVMAGRGADTMRYGPLRPRALPTRAPATARGRMYSCAQKTENAPCTTSSASRQNLKWGEQKRVFSMIPGLENAEFVRYGVMHRNTFLNSPQVMSEGL